MMQHFPSSPIAILVSLIHNRDLIQALVKREIIGRYRGSMLGIVWSFFNPLLMLVIYTFVFSVAFKARFGTSGESKADFAIVLFVGLIIHGLFAEAVNRAPGLILSNVNYVKKVVFPLEILPYVVLGSALFQALISLLVLLIAQLIFEQQLPWTAILFPFILLPLVFCIMGFMWLLSSLGVYMRDIGQMTGIFTAMLLFLSPVFYPISSLSAKYQFWFHLNPLTFIIEESRNTLIFGRVPNIEKWGLMLFISMLIAWAGFACFQKTRKGFADVL